MTNSLKPVRVLDLTTGQAMLAGNMLAKLGADIVAVEPPEGSPSRDWAGTGSGALWSAWASGKRGITCDLASAEGRARLARLAAGSDVVITGGDMSGNALPQIDAAALMAANPRLVFASITPFGEDGPKADYSASDLIVWAAGGALFPSRDGDRAPLRISSDQAMLHAASDAAMGILAALEARETSGRGQIVTVSAQESVAQATLSSVLATKVGHADFSITPRAPKPEAGAKKTIDLSGSGSRTRRSKWVVKDGVVEMHLAMGPAAGRFTNSLFAWLDSMGACNKRFAGWDWIKQVPEGLISGAITDDDMEAARADVAAVFSRYTKAELLEVTRQRRLTLAPVMTIADLAHSEHLAARKAFAEVEEAGRKRRISGAVAGYPEAQLPLRGAPAIGEHDAEVWAEIESGAKAVESVAAAVEARPKLPLEGLKVIDLAWVVAGPMVGRVLADCGAEVIRIESSKRIETARMMGPFPGGQFDPQRSALYENCNAGKAGLTLDLSSPEAREVVLDLAQWGDVVVESFAAGQLEKWGLDYDALRARNPGIILVRTSLMGQTGPLATLAGYGNIGAALSGFQSMVGYPDSEMIGPYGPYTDYVGPRFTTCALFAALAERRRTGKGTCLDVSQAEAGIQFLAPEFIDYFETGRVAGRSGNRVPNMAPHGVFPAAGEDRWVAIAVRGDAEWSRLAGLIGGAAADPRLAALAGRKADEDALEALIADWTSSRDALAIEQELQALGIPAHVVANADDMAADPQLEHLGHWVHFPHDLGGECVVEASRFRLSENPVGPRRSSPHFGRDNDHVLREVLGYPEDRIAALRDAGLLS